MMEGSKKRRWEAENKQQNKSTATDTNTQNCPRFPNSETFLW